MIKFLTASVAMLFSESFWEYGMFAVVLFFLFSILIKVIVCGRGKLSNNRKFYLLYPFVALVTIIPAVVLFQFIEVIQGLFQNRDQYALMGLGLNITAYFILNVIFGLLWMIFDKTISRIKEKHKC